MLRSVTCLIYLFILSLNAEAELIGYWSFDEGKGTVAKDFGPYGNDAAWQAPEGDGLTWELGILGGCARLQGHNKSGHRFDIPTLSGISESTDALTISVWFKPERQFGFGYKGLMMTRNVTDASPSGPGRNYGIGYEGGNRTDNRLSNIGVDSPNGTVSAGSWYHAAMVYDGTNLTAYVNGKFANSIKLSGVLPISANGSWSFGQDTSAVDRYFSGLIDDFAVWDEALDAAAIELIYKEAVQLGRSVGGRYYNTQGLSIEVDETAGNNAESFLFALTSKPESFPVKIKINGEFKNDFTLSADTLIFNSGNWNKPQVVTVSPIDNARNDGDRVFDLTFSSTPADVKLAPIKVELTIINDDIPTANPQSLLDGISNYWSCDTYKGGYNAILADEIGNEDGKPSADLSPSSDLKKPIKFGRNALHFRGSGKREKIDMGAVALLNDPKQSFSISLWINPDRNNNQYRGLFSRRSRVSSTSGLQIHDAKIIEARINGDQIDTQTADGQKMKNGSWYHAVMTYDADTDLVTSYCNMNFKSKKMQGNAAQPESYYLGWEGADENRYFYGQMDDIAIWNRALNVYEVAELYQNGEGVAISDLYTPVDIREGDSKILEISLVQALSLTDLKPVFPVTVTMSCKEDYSSKMTLSDTTLVFNDVSEIKTVTVTAIANSIQDFNQTFQIKLDDNDKCLIPSVGMYEVTILDDQLPELLVEGADQGQLVVGEGGVGGYKETASFTVAFTKAPEKGVTVKYKVSDVPGYLDVEPQELLFDDINYKIPQTISITVIENTIIEDSYEGTAPEAYYKKTIKTSIESDDRAFTQIAVVNPVVIIAENDCGALRGSIADISGPHGQPDCVVDFYDYALMVSEWMNCSLPNISNCILR